MALAFLAAALVLGVEPRLLVERNPVNSGAAPSFRVTASNHYSGWQFYSRSLNDVTGVNADDAVRDDRRDPERVNQRRRRDKHLEFYGSDGLRLGWDREQDQRLIEDFMRGDAPKLVLADAPPFWRMGISWFLAGFGLLTFLGAIQSFFPKKASA